MSRPRRHHTAMRRRWAAAERWLEAYYHPLRLALEATMSPAQRQHLEYLALRMQARRMILCLN